MPDVKLQIQVDYDTNATKRAGKEAAEEFAEAVADSTSSAGSTDAEMTYLTKKEALLRQMLKMSETLTKNSDKELKLLETKNKLAETANNQRERRAKEREAEAEALEERKKQKEKVREYKRVMHGISGGIRQLQSYQQAGGTESAAWGSAASIAGNMAATTPWLAPIAATLSLQHMKSEAQERWGEIRANLWRDVGNEGRIAFHETTMSGLDSATSPYKYGLSAEEQSHLIRGLGKGTGSIDKDQLVDMMKLQGYYAMGSEGLGLLSATTRAGAGKQSQEYNMIGAAIGIAMATQLERGRWGESFQSLTKAANSIVHGQANLRDIVQTQAFIGQLGPQYKGDTAARSSMESTLKTMIAGTGSGYADHMALKAAGFGSGTGYYEARLKMSRGAEAVGGVSPGDIVRQYATEGWVKAGWEAGGERRALVVMQVAKLAGVNGAEVEDMLAGYYGGALGRASKVDLMESYGKKTIDNTKPPTLGGKLWEGGDFGTRMDRFWTDAEKQRALFGGGPTTWLGSKEGRKLADSHGLGVEPWTSSQFDLLKDLGYNLNVPMNPALNPKLKSSFFTEGATGEDMYAPVGPPAPNSSSGAGTQDLLNRYLYEPGKAPYDAKLPYGFKKSGTDKINLSESERKAVIDEANRLGIPPEWLYMMVFSESGGDIAARAKDKDGKPASNAGLIGFGAKFQNQYGHTPDTMKDVSFEDQMKMVGDFYAAPAKKGMIKSPEDLKLYGFWPAGFNGGTAPSDDYVFFSNTGESSQSAAYWDSIAKEWNTKKHKNGKVGKKDLKGNYKTDWTGADVTKEYYRQNERANIKDTPESEWFSPKKGSGSDRDDDGKVTAGEVRKHFNENFARELKNMDKESAQGVNWNKGSVNLLIRVEDGRTSLTQDASKPSSVGAPGQQYMIKAPVK